MGVSQPIVIVDKLELPEEFLGEGDATRAVPEIAEFPYFSRHIALSSQELIKIPY